MKMLFIVMVLVVSGCASSVEPVKYDMVVTWDFKMHPHVKFVPTEEMAKIKDGCLVLQECKEGEEGCLEFKEVGE